MFIWRAHRKVCSFFTYIMYVEKILEKIFWKNLTYCCVGGRPQPPTAHFSQCSSPPHAPAPHHQFWHEYVFMYVLPQPVPFVLLSPSPFFLPTTFLLYPITYIYTIYIRTLVLSAHVEGELSLFRLRATRSAKDRGSHAPRASALRSFGRGMVFSFLRTFLCTYVRTSLLRSLRTKKREDYSPLYVHYYVRKYVHI